MVFREVMSRTESAGRTGEAILEVAQEHPAALTLRGPGFLLEADLGPGRHGAVWLEPPRSPEGRSAVVVFGWCYRIGSGRGDMNAEDLAWLLETHRQAGQPDLENLSGTFCLVSWDHRSGTMWISADLWGQQGFYYGSNRDEMVAGGRAEEVAQRLGASLDGFSYLSLLRGCEISPGRTLFAGVHRATPGRSLRLDLRARTARLVQTQPLFRPIQKIGFAEAVDQFVEVIQRVIPAAAEPPGTCVDLSGGNDTRMAAAVLAQARGGEIGRRATFRVAGPEGHKDVVTARRIAQTMGWNLVRDDRDSPLGYTEEALLQAARLSDGKFLLPAVMNRLAQERSHPQATGLVGCLAGELFRDYFWRQEMLNLGRTNQLNYPAFLKHKFYASPEVEAARISRGRMRLEDHDEALLNPYRQLDQGLPPVRNVYKLDRFYHFKMMHSNWSWIVADSRKVIMPFHSHEISRVSMTIPWRLRLGRRIITTGIQRLEPRLAAIPTDDGAPMEPLGWRTWPRYLAWLAWDVHSAYMRHFGRRRPSPFPPAGFSVPQAGLEMIFAGRLLPHLYDVQPALQAAKATSGRDLKRPQYLELQALLLVEALSRVYPGLEPALDFETPGADILHPEVDLLPPSALGRIAAAG
ncbi:MAG: hypothetical protein C4524_00080 [Candidatus Zixiibacteriota bacterium]|nr:MAG: hypothetical protein C4524_00080 [candidate division Zixibacteria bacterium]